MSESPLPRRRFWPPPPPTDEVKKEQTKLTAGLINALAIACFIAGLVGPVITTVSDDVLTPLVRLTLSISGLALHLAARRVLRYMSW